MGYAQRIDLFPGGAYGSGGVGAPVFVGRNRSVSLALDVTDALADVTSSVTLETAASQHSKIWRPLGVAFAVLGLGSTVYAVDNADAFVRARGTVAPLVSTSYVGLSLSGTARLVVVPPQALAGSGVTTRVHLAQYHGARLSAVVEDAPAGAELALSLERSGDGITWESAASWPVISAPGEYPISTADLDTFVRVRWSTSGIGAWTFGVAGTSHLIYARMRDRGTAQAPGLGIRSAAIPANFTAEQYLAALITATRTVETYYTRYHHPLRSWAEDTTQAIIALADWQLLCARGEEPKAREDGRPSIYATEADRWTTWLRQVGGLEPGGRKVVPSGIVDSAPANEAGQVKRWSIESDPNPLADHPLGWPVKAWWS